MRCIRPDKYVCHVAFLSSRVTGIGIDRNRRPEIKLKASHRRDLAMSFIPLRFHISRLLSKKRKKNDCIGLRSNESFSVTRKFHVNETDIMYNILRHEVQCHGGGETSVKHILESQLLFFCQLLLMLLHDSHFLPNETTTRRTLCGEHCARAQSMNEKAAQRLKTKYKNSLFFVSFLHSRLLPKPIRLFYVPGKFMFARAQYSTPREDKKRCK